MYKQQWWNENPFAKNCDEVSGGDSGGGISIYNIGKLESNTSTISNNNNNNFCALEIHM